MLFAKPKAGLKVIDPNGYTPLPPEGQNVLERDLSYWKRQEAFGDVELTETLGDVPTSSAQNSVSLALGSDEDEAEEEAKE